MLTLSIEHKAIFFLKILETMIYSFEKDLIELAAEEK
jgi:hypothetical protein